MKKHTIVVLDDGRTWGGDASVVKLNDEVYEQVCDDGDHLLPAYAEVGVDAATAADCVLEISAALSANKTDSEFRQEVESILRENITGIYPPGVAPAWMWEKNG